MRKYRVAVTRAKDAKTDATELFGDLGLQRLIDAGFEWNYVDVDPTIAADDLAGYDAVLLMGGQAVTRATLAGQTHLRHIARFGAGYDSVDVEACTDSGVVVTNTPEAVRRPMAHAALTLVLALAHNLVVKDTLVRTGRWDERGHWQGRGIEHALVGIVGLGNIGAEVARQFRALGMSVQAYNRSDKGDVARELGVSMVDLDTVMQTSDFIVILIAASAQTVNLVDRRRIGLMKPDAYLVNLSRGSIIDESALVEALQKSAIAGAGLDVFANEPLQPGSPLVGMDNVVLAPHSLCWTDEFARAVSESAITSLIDVGSGRPPRFPVHAGGLA